jgi:hypothetical protein
MVWFEIKKQKSQVVKSFKLFKKFNCYNNGEAWKKASQPSKWGKNDGFQLNPSRIKIEK